MDDGAHVMSLEPPALPLSRRSVLFKSSERRLNGSDGGSRDMTCASSSMDCSSRDLSVPDGT